MFFFSTNAYKLTNDRFHKLTRAPRHPIRQLVGQINNLGRSADMQPRGDTAALSGHGREELSALGRVYVEWHVRTSGEWKALEAG